MNSLSWFLYFADVVYQQVGLLLALCIAVPVLYVFMRLTAKISAENIWGSDSEELKKRKREEQSRPFFTTYKPFVFSVVGLFLVNLVPAKDTFYLIAASEAGEMVVNTPEAKEIMSDLKEILSIQLDKLKE